MTEGWILAALILFVGILVLVGIIGNSVRSCDEKRRYRHSERSGSLRGR